MKFCVRFNSHHLLVIAAAGIFAASASAQVSAASETFLAADSPSSSVSGSASLPDAPSVTVSPAVPFNANQAPHTESSVAPKYEKSISPDETAQTLTGGDKVVLSLRQLYAPLPFAGEILSGGYTHLVNGSPNYGSDGDAAAKRIGAAIARGSAQEVFTDAVFCPILHMDPRYYVEGPQYNFFHRAIYAGTRVLITRTDSGHKTINAPMLLGYAASSGLNNAYYPQINRNFKDTASEFGGSLGGAAIGFLFSEFADPILKAVHLQSK